MTTLYYHPYSQHSRRVIALLEEAGLPYELEKVALEDGAHTSSEYLRINPNHQVPTLVDGAVRIHESNAILRYLCGQHRLTGWYPEDPMLRATVDQWLDWNQCRLSPSVIDVVLNKVFLGDDGDQAAIERGEKNLVELLAILESGLADSDFLAGDEPTIADLSVASNVFQLSFADAAPSGDNTSKWFSKVMQIEGFRKSLPQQ